MSAPVTSCTATSAEDCVVPDCEDHPRSGKNPQEDIHLADMISVATRPTLAELYRRGKSRGLLKPSTHYH